MIVSIAVPVVAVLTALAAGWLLPAVGMRMLWPSLQRSAPKTVNYRGVPVATGLGVVWLVWVASVALVGAAAQSKTAMWEALAGRSIVDSPLYLAFAQSPVQTLDAMMPLLLVAGAFGFGMLDDVFGDASAKGFRGHLGAMRDGSITTGGLKMIGIGMLAFYAGAQVAAGEVPAIRGLESSSPVAAFQFIVAWVAATLVIGLAANLVNLLDLRPGRALKGYGALAVLGIAVSTVRLATGTAGRFASVGVFPVPTGPDSWALATYGSVMIGAMLLALAIGPAVAVWRYDVTERGMLGDAGANAAGALGGYLLATSLPIWGLIIAAALLSALNVISEKTSFSEIIEHNAVLRWLDAAGRSGMVEGGEPSGAPSTGTDTGKDG